MRVIVSNPTDVLKGVQQLSCLLVNMFLGMDYYDVETCLPVPDPKENMCLRIGDTKFSIRPHDFRIGIVNSIHHPNELIAQYMKHIGNRFECGLRIATNLNTVQMFSSAYVSAEIDMKTTQPLVILNNQSQKLKKEKFVPYKVCLYVSRVSDVSVMYDNGGEISPRDYKSAFCQIWVVPPTEKTRSWYLELAKNPLSLPRLPNVLLIPHRLYYEKCLNAGLLFTFVDVVFSKEGYKQLSTNTIYRWDPKFVDLTKFRAQYRQNNGKIPTPEMDSCHMCNEELTQHYYIRLDFDYNVLTRFCQFHQPNITNNQVVFRDYNPKLLSTEDLVKRNLKLRGLDFTELYKFWETHLDHWVEKKATEFPPPEYQAEDCQSQKFEYKYVALGHYFGYRGDFALCQHKLHLFKPGTVVFGL
jgi:hypothetical protein